MRKSDFLNRGLAGALLLALSGAPAAAQGVLEFVAQGPAGESGPPVKLVFEGRILDAGVDLAGPDDAGPSARRLRDLFAASRDGTPEDILALWRPEERDAVRPTVTELFEENRQLQRRIGTSRLQAEVLYGPYHLLAVLHQLSDGDAFVSLYPLIEEQGTYYLTQKLANDWVFIFLRSVFRARYAGGPEKISIPLRSLADLPATDDRRDRR